MTSIPVENFNVRSRLEHRHKEILRLEKQKKEIASALSELKEQLDGERSAEQILCLKILIKNKELELYDVDYNIAKNKAVFDQLNNKLLSQYENYPKQSNIKAPIPEVESYPEGESSDAAYTYDADFNLWGHLYNKRSYEGDNTGNKLVFTDPAVPVRFAYADDTATPIRDSYVIYWAYNGKDRSKTLELFELAHKYNLLYPIGIGRTDKNGFLLDTLLLNCVGDPKKLDLSKKSDFHKCLIEKKTNQLSILPKDNRPDFILSHHVVSDDFDQRNGDFRVPEWKNKDEQDTIRTFSAHRFPSYLRSDPELIDWANQISVIQRGKKVENTMRLSSSVPFFDRNTTYGFMVYPADWAPFKTKDLTRIDKKYVWVGSPRASFKPIQDHKYQCIPETIPLHCTLAEWDARLSKAIIALEDKQNQYDAYTKKHAENLNKIQHMGLLTDLYLQYPFEPQKPSNIKAKERLIDNLNAFGMEISNIIHTPSPSNTCLQNFVQEIDKSAEVLWKLLQSEALWEELEIYIKAENEHIKAKQRNKKAEIDLPYMEREGCWKHIFDTISRAYSTFKGTKLEATVWEDDLLPGILAITEHPETLEHLKRIEEQILEDRSPEIIELRGRLHNKGHEITDRIDKHPAINKESLFKRIIDFAFKPANAISKVAAPWYDAPGPPSILQTILDDYGDYALKLYADPHKRIHANYHIKIMAGVYRFFNLFERSEKAAERNIHRAMKDALKAGSTYKNGKRLWRESWLADTIYKQGDRFSGTDRHSRAAKIIRVTMWITNTVLATEKILNWFENDPDDSKTLKNNYEVSKDILNYIQDGCSATQAGLVGYFLVANHFGRTIWDYDEFRRIKQNIKKLQGIENRNVRRRFKKQLRKQIILKNYSVDIIENPTKLVKLERRMLRRQTLIGLKDIGMPVTIGFIGSLLSTLAFFDALDKKDSRKAFACFLEASASFAIAAGWVMKKMGKKELVILLGKMFVKYGNYLSLAFLLWDLKHIGSFLTALQNNAMQIDRPVLLYFKTVWDQMQEDEDYFQMYKEKDHGATDESIRLYREINGCYSTARELSNVPRGLHIPKRFDSEEKKKEYIESAYPFNYRLKEWARDIDTNKKSSEKAVEVIWGHLNWRAVVPLHLYNFPVEAIKSLVMIPKNVPCTVEQILAFYKEVSEPEPKRSKDKNYIGRCRELSEQLVSGTFIPDAGNPEKDYFSDPYFQKPKTRNRYYEDDVVTLNDLLDDMAQQDHDFTRLLEDERFFELSKRLEGLGK